MIIKLKITLLTFALISGAIYAHSKNHTNTTETCEIITLSAEPVNYLEVNWIRKYNPSLSEAEANELYRHIENTIKKYHNDPSYQKGVTKQVTPRLVLCLILRESRCDPQTLGSSGEIGLTQVYPKHHIKALKSAGIIQDKNDLWQVEANVEAGIYILMNISRKAESLKESLAIYNAGYQGQKRGRKHAERILRMYQEIEG